MAAEGPIEIVVRSISHDGKSLLEVVHEGVLQLYEAYAQDSASRPELAETILPKLRELDATVELVEDHMSSVGRSFDLGQTPRVIMDMIKGSVQEACVLVNTRTIEIGKSLESISSSIGEEELGQIRSASHELEAFVVKMVAIGERILNSKNERVSLEREFGRALEDVRSIHLGVGYSRHGRFRSAIYANRGAVYLMFRELLSNSFKYRADGRELRLTTHEIITGDGVTISLSDNGIGIPAEHCRGDIFKSGFRLPEAVALDDVRRHNSQGQGLGLAIVKRIVAYLKGSIRAASDPGAGVRFEIEFESAA